MTRNLRLGQLRRDIRDDLREHEPLLELLDTSELDGVQTIENTARQVYSSQTIQDTDVPIGVSIGMMRTGGDVTQSTATADVVVQATVTARLQWRQAVDQDPDLLLSEDVMDTILDAVGDRAAIGFGIPYLTPGGLIGGSEMLESEEGAQWSLPARWEVSRTVVGDDGPRSIEH